MVSRYSRGVADADDSARVDELIAELAAGKVERKLGLADAAALAARLHGQVDRGVAERAAMIEAKGWQVACKLGCAYCCEEPVMVHRPEAARVARWLDLPENAAARAAFRAAYPAWRDHQGDTPARLADVYVRDPASYVDAHAKAWAKRVPCAFNVAGACSIYAVRPIVCRTAHALDTAEACIGGTTQARQRATFVPLDQFVARARQLLAAAHQAARGPKGRVEALCAVVYELLPPVPRS
jgi:Fe-S-cluster containining protein